MNKLIALELKRSSLGPYHIAAVTSGVAVLAFQYLLAAIPHIDPTEPDIEMFSSYRHLIGMGSIICMAVFTVLAAVIAARFVVEEYTGKRAVLAFSYPVSRKRMFGAKLVLVFLYTAAAMLLCGSAVEGVFLITETFFPLCGDRLTFGVVLGAFGAVLCNGILAGLLGLLSLWAGLWKQSVPVTIVTAVITASLVCQIMAACSWIGAIVVLGAAVVLTAFAVTSMMRQIENMEV